MPTMFSQDIWRRFKDAPEKSTEFINDFRQRPVAYIVESYRLNQFPAVIRTFFAEHYVWYARSLFIAGFDIDTAKGPRDIDVIAPGQYRWVPGPGHSATSIQLDDTLVPPLAVIHLGTGHHRIVDFAGAAKGTLILADLPVAKKDSYPAFYHQRQIAQLGGYR